MNHETFLHKYLRLTPQLYRVALRLVGNAQEAEDMVQDTFVKVWDRRDQLGDEANIEAYFQVALRHVCINQLRSRHEEVIIEDEIMVSDESDRTGRVTESDTLLHRLFSKLTPKAQRVMGLRHVGEYSTRDIAQITGESEENVRSILSRSRRQLRQAYEQITHSNPHLL